LSEDRKFTTKEKLFLQLVPVGLMVALLVVIFAFYRFGIVVTEHFGKLNENAEQLVTDGRKFLCGMLAGAIGAYLRIALNLPAMRKNDPKESMLIATVQIISGGIVGFFVYVVIRSKVLVNLLYLGDFKNVELNWQGAIALSLLAGLAAPGIVNSILKTKGPASRE
jgi:hypothetical protein